MTADKQVEVVLPGEFVPEQHYYDRVLNSNIHPLISYFLRMTRERVISRYCHLNPKVSSAALDQLLRYEPKYLRWAGADLIHVTTEDGRRELVVIETNSCPSGQKSMPLFSDHLEQGGYGYLIEKVFAPLARAHRMKSGDLAVIYDKNYMEASGYARAMADLFKCRVLLVPCYDGREDRPTRFRDGVLQVREPGGDWVPVRAAMRYVTQRPWNRIPLDTKTLILNPIIACLSGGRNKLAASMAYDLINAELAGTGLSIRTPETIREVDKWEVPLVVRRFGGYAVVKVPYTNAGQGVYTITNASELAQFMAMDHHYERFIVQSLIGNYGWSSSGAFGKFYHVGTIPDRNGRIFVADLRMMVGATEDGFRPIVLYGRRAPDPLVGQLDEKSDSRNVLVTNLSQNRGENQWEAETSRLMIMDRKDFNQLGLGLDELITGFIQAVLAATAIDKLACALVNKKGKFSRRLFRSINNDSALIDEIMPEREEQ